MHTLQTALQKRKNRDCAMQYEQLTETWLSVCHWGKHGLRCKGFIAGNGCFRHEYFAIAMNFAEKRPQTRRFAAWRGKRQGRPCAPRAYPLAFRDGGFCGAEGANTLSGRKGRPYQLSGRKLRPCRRAARLATPLRGVSEQLLAVSVGHDDIPRRRKVQHRPRAFVQRIGIDPGGLQPIDPALPDREFCFGAIEVGHRRL